MSNTFDYTDEQLQNPRGRNTLGSRSMFFQRSLYKEAIYPTAGDIPLPQDTWYNKMQFGKVDRDQNVIIFRPGRARPIIRAVTTNVLVLDFVAEAFNAFAEHMNRAKLMGAVDSNGNSIFYRLKAVKGIENPHLVYKKYQKKIFDAFFNNLSKRDKQKIKNFPTFVEIYAAYLKDVATKIPITKGNFLLTNRVSPMISGLSIALTKDSFGHDFNKYESYLTDENFDFFSCAAKKFGFLVNKNAPWILTADLFSDAIKKYWVNLPGPTELVTPTDPGVVTESNFFETYYTPVYKTELYELLMFLVNSYSKLIQKKPFYTNERILMFAATDHVYSQCEGQLVSFPLGRRTPLQGSPSPWSHAAALTEYSPGLKPINLYLALKQIESGNSIKNLNQLQMRVNELETVGTSSAGTPDSTELINDFYKEYTYGSLYKKLAPGEVSLDIKRKSGTLTSVNTIHLLNDVP